MSVQIGNELAEIISLLEESVEYIRSLYEEERNHTYSLSKLIENGELLTLRYNGKLIGCGAYIWVDDEIELKHMYVKPFYRGLGYGKKILKHIEDIAIYNDVKSICLRTSEKQQEAISLYKSRGFEICEPYTTCFHAKEIFMRKPIDKRP